MGETVILANGEFPAHPVPVAILKGAARIICCDGATGSLIRAGFEPFAIVGDCDSVDEETAKKFSDRLFRSEEQETNDLTKAVKWCHEKGFNDVVILGATGKREDHTIGNISLLADYTTYIRVRMVTDYGTFHPLTAPGSFKANQGRQISIFSIDPETAISSEGLKYPLRNLKLTNWWQATLNEAVGESFSLNFEGGTLIVFIAF